MEPTKKSTTSSLSTTETVSPCTTTTSTNDSISLCPELSEVGSTSWSSPSPENLSVVNQASDGNRLSNAQERAARRKEKKFWKNDTKKTTDGKEEVPPIAPGAVYVEGHKHQGDDSDRGISDNYDVPLATEVVPDEEDVLTRLEKRFEQRITEQVNERLAARQPPTPYPSCNIPRRTCRLVSLLLLLIGGGGIVAGVLVAMEDDSGKSSSEVLSNSNADRESNSSTALRPSFSPTHRPTSLQVFSPTLISTTSATSLAPTISQTISSTTWQTPTPTISQTISSTTWQTPTPTISQTIASTTWQTPTPTTSLTFTFTSSFSAESSTTLLDAWNFCDSSAECANDCCSNTYSDDGRLKCTDLDGGFDPNLCI